MTEASDLPRGTLADRVYADMRAAIVNGSLPAGSALNQVGLAREFGVSRVPIREALRRLQAEHLVSVRNYHQYVVTPIDPETLVELIEIRAELEVLAVQRRIPDIEAKSIDELRVINARLRGELDASVWFKGDIDFHYALNGPGSETAALVRRVRDRVHRDLQMVASTEPRRLEACREHDEILNAFAAKDPRATEKALRNHIQHTQTVILEYLQPKGVDRMPAFRAAPVN